VSDPAQPEVVGTALSDEEEYFVTQVVAVGSLACAGTGDGRIYTVDLSDPAAPSVLGEVWTALLCEDLSIRDSFLYSSNSAGVCVVDVSNPAAPEFLGYAWTGNRCSGVAAAAGAVCSAAPAFGLELFPLQCGAAGVDEPESGPGSGPSGVAGSAFPRIALTMAPNPASPTTELRLRTEAGATAAVRIFDAAGRIVRVLWAPPGGTDTRALRWDGRDSAGRPLPSGSYYVEAATARGRATGRLILLQ